MLFLHIMQLGLWDSRHQRSKASVKKTRLTFYSHNFILNSTGEAKVLIDTEYVTLNFGRCIDSDAQDRIFPFDEWGS